MNPYGSDRVRFSAGKVILQARLSKGWTPRTPKSETHAEFPGTAVQWDEEMFEVVDARLLPAGGVRYVLEPWRDDHTIRLFEPYSEESEARLAADFEKAKRQRKHSLFARLSGVVLGHLPAPVQMRLADELGIFPARMTLLSIVPSLGLMAACVWLYVESRMTFTPSPIPLWLWAFTMFMLADSAVRFQVAMSQNRGIGSFPGTLAYALFWRVMRRRMSLPAPFEGAKGEKVFMLPPSEEVAAHDSVAWRSWMLSLLSPQEQARLAERYGYDYRKHSRDLAWALLAVGTIGIISSVPKLQTFSGFVSLLVAGLIVLEQALRLLAFRRGPAGSFFGILVRPFVQDLLRSEGPKPSPEDREPTADGIDEL